MCGGRNGGVCGGPGGGTVVVAFVTVTLTAAACTAAGPANEPTSMAATTRKLNLVTWRPFRVQKNFAAGYHLWSAKVNAGTGQLPRTKKMNWQRWTGQTAPKRAM